MDVPVKVQGRAFSPPLNFTLFKINRDETKNLS